MFAVGMVEGHFVKSVIRNESIDATTFVLELAHRLFERATEHADEIRRRHANIGIENLAEMTVRSHIFDGSNFNTRRVHRHDYFADALVG